VDSVVEPGTSNKNADGEGNQTVIAISKEAWAKAKTEVNDSTPIPEGSTQADGLPQASLSKASSFA
jgi:hypothetical protein